MKKIIIIVLSIIVALLAILGIFYNIDVQKMSNNEPVVFSTWGYDYTVPVNNEEVSSDNVGPTTVAVGRIVMVDGVLYYDTGQESTIDARCGNMDGQITSAVSENEVPTVNDQSNFGTDYGYQRFNGTIEIPMNGKWIVFEAK